MKFHPAVLMILTWVIAFALFFILPFNLVGRTMSLYGYLVLFLFLATFCGGALMASRPMPQRPRDPAITVDWRRADQVLMGVALMAIIFFVLDLYGKNVFDLASAYAERSDRASDLLNGAASDSTLWFRIGFLLYPASYVTLVREIGFRSKPRAWRVAAFGLLPIILAALSMGGRGPLLFCIIFAAYGYNLRRQIFPPQKAPQRMLPAARRNAAAVAPAQDRRRRAHFNLGPGPKVAMGVLASLAMVYFVQVFITRAEVGGGIEEMFGRVGLNWGVSFDGHFSGLFYSTFGVETTYMIFVFAWYAIQGIVMSNSIFTDYDGPVLLGTYGVDLVSALMRRINGGFVADGFDRLLQMNVYGFVPSAFGSLYVDFHFFGLLPCLGWGWLTGLVYRKVKSGVDPRYLLLVPFVTIGIVWSLNNTPIGLSNGLVMHFWLLIAFFLARTVGVRPAAKASASRPVRFV